MKRIKLHTANKERCDEMAVFQLIFDHGSEASSMLAQLPYDVMELFEKEGTSISLKEREQKGFRLLWAYILAEMHVFLEAYDKKVLEESMDWLLAHELQEVCSVCLLEGDWKRYVLSFSDTAWKSDLRVQIAFGHTHSQYGEQESSKGKKALFLVNQRQIQEESCYLFDVGNAMRRALEEPMPMEYFDELCENLCLRVTLPYLVLFELHPKYLQIRSIREEVHRFS